MGSDKGSIFGIPKEASRQPSQKLCAHTEKWRFLVCVRAQLLIYVNNMAFFLQKSDILLVTLQKARNFASSKGKKTVTSE